MGCAVHNGIGLHLPGQFQHLLHIGDIQISHIRIDQFIFSVSFIQRIQRSSQLSVTAGDQ